MVESHFYSSTLPDNLLSRPTENRTPSIAVTGRYVSHYTTGRYVPTLFIGLLSAMSDSNRILDLEGRRFCHLSYITLILLVGPDGIEPPTLAL
jgi:hypothetical protein